MWKYFHELTFLFVLMLYIFCDNAEAWFKEYQGYAEEERWK